MAENEFVIVPPADADVSKMPLLADMQFLDPYGSESINRKFYGVIPEGIYRGFKCALLGGMGLAVGVPNDPGTAVVATGGVCVTVQQRSPVHIQVPAGFSGYVVLTAHYQFGVPTKQVHTKSLIDAAKIELVSVANRQPNQIIICSLNVPGDAVELTLPMVSDEKRQDVSIAISSNIFNELTKHITSPTAHTKDQVGLSHLNNWPASASISNPSDQEYATSGAVNRVRELASQPFTPTTSVTVGGTGGVYYPVVLETALNHISVRRHTHNDNSQWSGALSLDLVSCQADGWGGSAAMMDGMWSSGFNTVGMGGDAGKPLLGKMAANTNDLSVVVWLLGGGRTYQISGVSRAYELKSPYHLADEARTFAPITTAELPATSSTLLRVNPVTNIATAAGINISGVGVGEGLSVSGKTAIGGPNDSWLRLNPHSQFTDGIYTGTQGLFRHDGVAFSIGDFGVSPSTMLCRASDEGWSYLNAGRAALSVRVDDSVNAHWVFGSYRNANALRSGLQILSNEAGLMRFFTNGLTKHVDICDGNAFAGAPQSSAPNALTRLDFVESTRAPINHRHDWGNLDNVPAGLGTYAAHIANVATDLRSQSGFYNAAPTTANRMPFGSDGQWHHLFNSAHANAAGYNGVIGVGFDGSVIGFTTVINGGLQPWKEIWHSGSSRIQAQSAGTPMFELHIPGKVAKAMHLGADNAIHWSRTNGAGAVVSELASLQDGSLSVNGALWSSGNSHAVAEQHLTKAPFHVDFGAVPGESDYYPIVRGKSAVVGQGYTTQVELGMLRDGGPRWGDGIILVKSGEGATPAAIFRFGITGDFSAPGAIIDTGQRVYSPNNIPTAEVIGAVGAVASAGEWQVRDRRLATGEMRVATDGGLKFRPEESLNGHSWGIGMDSSGTLNIHRYQDGLWQLAALQFSADNTIIARSSSMQIRPSSPDNCPTLVFTGNPYGNFSEIAAGVAGSADYKWSNSLRFRHDIDAWHIGDNRIYHTGFVPSAAVVGAVPNKRIVNNSASLNDFCKPEHYGLYQVEGYGTEGWPWDRVSAGSLFIDGVDLHVRQTAWRADCFDTVTRFRNPQTGVWSPWASVYNSEYCPRVNNWANFEEAKRNVSGGLIWRHYGNSHVIFDSSAGLSPDGKPVNNRDATIAWSATYPTLMGWNGVDTYGVRVDSARIADTATSAPNYLPLSGGAVVRDVGDAPNFASGQLEIRGSGGSAACLGFHRPGVLAHSIQLRKDFAGLSILNQDLALGQLRTGGLTADSVVDSGHRVFSPVNPPNSSHVGLGNVENKKWVLRGSGSCSFGLTNGRRDYRGRIDTGIPTDSRIFDPSRYRVVLKTMGSISTSGDPNGVWWHVTGEIMPVTYWSQTPKLFIEVYTSGGGIGSGVVDVWEVWEWA